MMSPSIRRELYKLRELCAFLLKGRICYFCNKPISEAAEMFTEHGNSVGPKLLDKISIHHINGDHNDNRDENKALCHTSCHKSYHRREANLARSRKEVDSTQ